MYAAYKSSNAATNWNTWFYDAAYPNKQRGLGSPNMGMKANGEYEVAAEKVWSLHIPEATSKDRRAVVQFLSVEHPLLTVQPPSEYVWGPNKCPTVGVILEDDFVPALRRRVVPKRERTLYYDPCPANTFYGLGWYAMPGFEPSQPEPTEEGCRAPLLYHDVRGT